MNSNANPPSTRSPNELTETGPHILIEERETASDKLENFLLSDTGRESSADPGGQQSASDKSCRYLWGVNMRAGLFELSYYAKTT
jgi:hypothetical protein